MKNLLDVFTTEYKMLFEGVPELIPDDYEIKNYYLVDNENFRKVVYFDTDKGFFQSKSRTLIGSLYGLVGKIIEDILKDDTVFVEIVNKRTTSGKYGLAFKLY